MSDPPSLPNRYSTILSYGDDPRRYRRLELKSLGPGAMKDLRDRVENLADDLVARHANGDTFDAMEEFTAHLPIEIVGGLVGLKGVDTATMLRWSAALFDGFGPMYLERVQAALGATMEFAQFMGGVNRDSILPGSWAAQLFEAADRGDISEEEAGGLISDFVVPSLDTTVQSTAEMLYQLGRSPDAYQRLQADPSLATNAVYESVRLVTPLRGFTRLVTSDFALSESTLPAGSRAWLLLSLIHI